MRKEAEALSLMTERTCFLARRPRFNAISLHRSLKGRSMVNHIQWQSRNFLQSTDKSAQLRKERGQLAGLVEKFNFHTNEIAHVTDRGEVACRSRELNRSIHKSLVWVDEFELRRP